MPRAPITVIVAEKNAIARAALAALLTQDGYRVFQAASSKEALFHIDSLEHPAVLLADLDMPGWGSIVQQAISNSSALVVSMASIQHLRDSSELKDRGIQVCLTKPIVYRDVQKAIQENLRIQDTAKSPTETVASVAQTARRKAVLT